MTILDTNVVSELMKPLSSPAVIAWMSDQPTDAVFTTAITVAEVLYGIELLPKGRRRDQLLQQAEATFAEDFADRILSFDEQAAKIFPLIAASRRRQGRPMSEFDAQIAAIAKANEAMLATRNTGDFESCGVRLINPWQIP